MCHPQLGVPHHPSLMPSGGGWGNTLPPARPPFLQVCASLGANFSSSVHSAPSSSVYTALTRSSRVGLGVASHLFTPAPTSVWLRARLPGLVSLRGVPVTGQRLTALLWTEFVQNPQSQPLCCQSALWQQWSSQGLERPNETCAHTGLGADH